MAQYTMCFIQTMPYIDRTQDEWEFGLTSFGYEECESVPPINLKAIDREGAALEAFQLWHEWEMAPTSTDPEGYWIADQTGDIFSIFGKDVMFVP